MKNSKSGIIEKLIWIPVIVCILCIFGMSLQSGDVSTASSAKIAEDITGYKILGMDVSLFIHNEDEFDMLHEAVRTMAHVAEFMGLAVLVCIAVTVCGVKGKLRFFYMLGIGLAVSLCDEFIQIFVPGRYCDLSDIICDFGGTLFIALIGLLFRGKRRESDGERRFNILGIAIDNISFDDALERIMTMASQGQRKYVLTPNADHIVKVDSDKEFAKIYEDADLVTVDGVPIMWIADSCSYKIRQRVTGSDMFPKVCEQAAKRGNSIFILGAADNVAKEAVSKLEDQYKGITISGTFSPEVGFENDDDMIAEIISKVNEASPDILVLALGSPKQEKFIYNYREKMNFNVALPFGAAVDFVAGNVERAPLWMRKSGLEWLYRFLQEPGRLFKRYFIDDIKIFWIAWKYRHDVGYDNISGRSAK